MGERVRWHRRPIYTPVLMAMPPAAGPPSVVIVFPPETLWASRKPSGRGAPAPLRPQTYAPLVTTRVPPLPSPPPCTHLCTEMYSTLGSLQRISWMPLP